METMEDAMHWLDEVCKDGPKMGHIADGACFDGDEPGVTASMTQPESYRLSDVPKWLRDAFSMSSGCSWFEDGKVIDGDEPSERIDAEDDGIWCGNAVDSETHRRFNAALARRYDPSEPRSEAGRWVSIGGSRIPTTDAPVARADVMAAVRDHDISARGRTVLLRALETGKIKTHDHLMRALAHAKEAGGLSPHYHQGVAKHGEGGSHEGLAVNVTDAERAAREPTLSAKERHGMHPASADEMALHKILPGLADVHVADDPEAGATYKGKDVEGRTKSGISEAAKAAADAIKWPRVATLSRNLPDVTRQLEATMQAGGTGADEAAALLTMIHSGKRVGSDADTKAKAKAYGVTTLEPQHVTVDDDGTVHLSFIGKEGIPNTATITGQPALAAELRRRAETAATRGGRLFRTNSVKTQAHLIGVHGAPAKNHDLRTAFATVAARDKIASMPVPTTSKEYAAARKQVGEHVAGLLNNGAKMALDNYIHPGVFKRWQKGIKV